MSTFTFNESPWGDGNPGQFNLLDFTPRAGIFGPQVITTWNQSEWPAARIMIRRKKYEYPRDPTDGVLVYDNSANPSQENCAGDLGTDLLAADAVAGDSQFWYVRAFVIPAARELEDQFGGDGVQLATIQTDPVDMQLFDRMTVYATTTVATITTIETAPTELGPWSTITNIATFVATTIAFNVPGGVKYVRVRATNAVDVYSAPQLGEDWFSSDDMSQPVLAFKTGKHMHLWEMDLNLPNTYWTQDIDHLTALLNEAEVDCETFNVGLANMPQGILKRFLTLFALELDRADAYTRNLMTYGSIQEVPPH